MPKTDWFKGIFPAMVTPFDGDGCLDEEALRRLTRHLMPHVDGLVPCGTTGEFMYMSAQERGRVLDVVLDEVKGKVPVIAGTGAPSTKEAIELTQYAKDAGARAALVVTPYYYKPAFNELYAHYDRLNALDFPLIMYNIPQCTGVHFRWWTAEGIADMENVIGIKDSSGDMPFLMSLFEKVKGQISIVCGHDEMGMPALAAGCDGLILASANLIPDVWQEVYSAVQSGDLERARVIQASIQKLVRIVVRAGANQAAKEGLGMMGVQVGDSRLPIMPGGVFKRDDREELRLQLEALGKIPGRNVDFEVVPGRTVTSGYPATPVTPAMITDFTMKVGEGFCGPPAFELAHIDLLVGSRDGPVGKALDGALKRQTGEGPGKFGDRLRLARDRPRTLIVPTVTVRTQKQARHVYELAADGVNLAIDKSIGDDVLPEGILDDVVMIANVFVHPAAENRKRIKFNNYKAMLHALRKALEGRPTVEELLREKDSARHPFKYAP